MEASYHTVIRKSWKPHTRWLAKSIYKNAIEILGLWLQLWTKNLQKICIANKRLLHFPRGYNTRAKPPLAKVHSRVNVKRKTYFVLSVFYFSTPLLVNLYLDTIWQAETYKYTKWRFLHDQLERRFRGLLHWFHWSFLCTWDSRYILHFRHFEKAEKTWNKLSIYKQEDVYEKIRNWL